MAAVVILNFGCGALLVTYSGPIWGLLGSIFLRTNSSPRIEALQAKATYPHWSPYDTPQGNDADYPSRHFRLDCESRINPEV